MLALAVLISTAIFSQTFPVNSFDYSTNLTPGYNVLLPDSTNQLWQLGKSSKFDGVLSSKPALYTDTLTSYPINVDEGIVMMLYDASGINAYHWYDVYFKHRFETDSLVDGAYIEVSLDSGSTWVNAIDYMDSISWPMWGPYSVDFYSTDYLVNGQRSAFTGRGINYRQSHIHLGLITAIVANPEIIDFPLAPYLRFSFVSDSIDTQKAGWQIDEVEIWGVITSGIEERLKPIVVLPNPSSGLFRIQSVNHQDLYFEVSDLKGRKILTGRMNGTSAAIDLSSYPSGTYLLKFEDGTAIKLVKRQ
jgi:hypothetical protein